MKITNNDYFHSQGSWIEVNLDHISWNIEQLRSFTQKPLMAVVKGNAYGHGLIEVSKYLEKNKINWLLTGKINEAVKIRENDIKSRILNIGFFSKRDCKEIIQNDFSQAVFSDNVIALNEIATKYQKKVAVQIHLDTGLGRVGIPCDKALSYIEMVNKLPYIKIEGIMTTLFEEKGFDREQLDKLNEIYNESKKREINLGLRHAASSAAILNLPSSYLDIIRPGITIFGYYPSPSTQRENLLKLKKALKLKSRVVNIKKIKPGEALSYHRQFVAKQTEYIATIGGGYCDGIPASIVDKGSVLIKGVKCPIVAEVTANHFWARLQENQEVKLGDEVIIIDNKTQGSINAADLAGWSGTSTYQILLKLNPNLSKKYFEKRNR